MGGMGSSAKNFVSGSLLLCLSLCGWSFAQPTAAASQDSPEEAIFNQAMKEVTQELEQLKKNQALAQKMLRQQRLAGEFASLLATAKQQHTKIKRWQKGHSIELRISSTKVNKKRRLLVARTSPR